MSLDIPLELLPPTCPECGSSSGVLGTSNAYFVCHNMGCLPERRQIEKRASLEIYWLGDHRHPDFQGKTWRDAVRASPYGPYGSGAYLFQDESK